MACISSSEIELESSATEISAQPLFAVSGPTEDCQRCRTQTRLLAGKVALVTGASQGIGRALAECFAREEATLCLVARSEKRLLACADDIRRQGGCPKLMVFAADLRFDKHIDKLAAWVMRRFKRLDILVHSAGTYARGPLESANVKDFDRQYRANLRGPYLLTQKLLPYLKVAQGEIVFINSSQGLAAASEVGQFAATQHGLLAVADSLRQEVNAAGVRVLTAHLGRTATPRQEAIFAQENRSYVPERLIQPSDVASVVLAALSLARSAEVTSMTVRPMMNPL